MTVQKDVTKNIYVGNSSTRTFPFTFECPAEHLEYIKVYLMQDDGTALATSDYQLDMDAKQITYPSSGTALPEGKKLVIMRELPLQQMMNLVNNGPYFAEDIETAFDECVMAMQQIAEKLNRSIIMSVDIDGDAFVNEVPFEAGKSFRIADDGKSIVLTEDPAKVLPLVQGVYAQTQAQAQSAAASAVAAAKSEDSAAASASKAGNSAQSASVSAASAAENAELTSGYKQEALNAKADATASATNAKASEANAEISENNAEASKEAAQSAASNANNFATSARSSASEAKSYRDAANNYAANAKNYSENVNVFLPSVSASGVLSWTNKAGLANPASVNIKGAKGDTGATGAAATITIGSVTTGEPGTNASVSNSGTSTNAILNFMIPRGNPGSGGGSSVDVDAALSDSSLNPVQNKVIKEALDGKLGKTETAAAALHDGAGNIIVDTYAKKTDITNITVDSSLSDTSTNPVQNKVVYNALANKINTEDILSGFALLGGGTQIRWREGTQFIGAISATNYSGKARAATLDGDGNKISTTYAKKTDISGMVKSVNNIKPDSNGNVTIEVSGSGISTSESNTWTAEQIFYALMLNREKYTTYVVNGTSDTPITSTMVYAVTGAFTLDLATLAGTLSASQSSVFTAYFAANADYSLTISNAGNLKYVGSASDVAITSAGLLLNIMMLKDASGNLTSIIQASKLEGGA